MREWVFTVIARSEATWQSVLFFVAGMGSLRGKGKRIAAPVCALARNDRETGTLSPYLSLRGSRATWQSVLFFVTGTNSERCKGKRIAAPVCALARNDRETGTLSPYLSLRGAKRRGNPFSFLWQV